ncbi:BatA domain-containing protein [Polaribacter vadi]|uniref:BatA domain-containing protein n=1 Tax=Polaribacter TaxID=52959 RepID=UPI001C09C98D|nr:MULTISPECIES: BatA domain-containing protein [Polaribacter]MBU3011983.1 BatA domain-containing protein [Polaribacter vadi]MDO6741798.1 BatA domain-containing protein [Polaribacter sp. 1_MG-2023]
MQFQNPEILYFLALLIIPILVHLFQLQKFVKTPFTNVAFLQKLVQQTRKSSRIKKWLILATRLLLLSAIIIAFSQPYFSSKKTETKQHTFIYLDNSLSTNSTGEKGNLLKIAAQEIIENTSRNDRYSLQTNTDFYKDISYQDLKNNLLNIENSAKKVEIKNIFLKINSSQKNKTNTLYKSIFISDFQNTYNNEFTNVTKGFSGIKLESSKKNNISIDSVFTTTTNTTNLTVNVVVKNQGDAKNNIPIAIYNKEKLVSKQSFSINENENKTITFTLQNVTEFLGKLDITFSDTFLFDNSFYFSINTSKKINILSIGNDTNFLSKIYTKDEFNFSTSTLQNINYNAIPKQQIIILNELKKIPETLSKSIVNFSKKGGTIVIIPNIKSEVQSYNLFLNKIAGSKIKSKISDTLKITNINFNHPLFKNVFSKKVLNFQYPVVKSYYPILSKNKSNIISFENNSSFISEINSSKNKVYWVSSSLSKNNSNFLNSPLVVPTFYNFGKLSFQHQKLYYYLNKENKIDVETNLEKDEILTIVNQNSSFIPSQQTYQNKVSISTKDNPTKVGFYNIISKKDTLQTIAFNNPKEESSLNFLDLNSLRKENKNINFNSSIAEVFNDLNKKNEVQWLWKWFLALAIVSLLLEIFILKFYKP